MAWVFSQISLLASLEHHTPGGTGCPWHTSMDAPLQSMSLKQGMNMYKDYKKMGQQNQHTTAVQHELGKSLKQIMEGFGKEAREAESSEKTQYERMT